MAQDKHPDCKLIETQYGANLPTLDKNGRDPTKTIDAVATTMGAGWDRNRAQQALREMCIR